MKTILCSLLAVSALSAMIGCGSTPKKEEPVASKPAPALPTTVEEAVKSPFRTAANLERDQYRHPVETLNFFDIKPDMTVIEVAPGAGWYMEILAPYLAEKGQYIAATVPSTPDNTYMTKLNEKTAAWLKQFPEVESKAKNSAFNPPTLVELGPEGSADRVVTFRNVHNWVSKDGEKAAFQAFFKVLKPGGILGVVEHRANPKSKRDPKAKSGYVLEKDIIRIAKSAGFKLDAKSEINANAKDTKDYPEGVWTLAPSYRLKDQDREKYAAIGESDRMTLRFIKPVKK